MSDTKIINKLTQFGEGFKHHHENYEASSISTIREKGGVWDFGTLTFHFPQHFGFCYGVDKAIDMVFETCARFTDKRVFLTDQLIHNPYINGKLLEKGVCYLKRDEKNLLLCDELKEGDVVVVSAFGTDFRDILNLKEKKVMIVDSTCGAIINVWKRVEGYAKNGFVTVMHGKRNHEETRATVSQAVKENGQYITIENIHEAQELALVIEGKMTAEDFAVKYPGACSQIPNVETLKVGMANQTTMLKGESLEIQNILRNAFTKRFGADQTLARFRSFDTICGATQDRQDALRQLLEHKPDLVIIVGGFNSSNTSHLAEIADQKVEYYHIEGEHDILSDKEIRGRNPKTGNIETYSNWLKPKVKNIGITSGASTPDVTLLEIIKKIVAFKEQ